MSAAEQPAPRGDRVRTVLRGLSQTLVTVGLVALLFVAYQVWFTDVLAAREQDRLTEQVREQWADAPTVTAPEGRSPAPSGPPAAAGPPAAGDPAPRPAPVDVEVGEPFAVLHVPRLGDDYARVVVEGTSQAELAQGPGHYPGTALPGEQGNLALAGHRVGRGSPFLDLDRLRPGDALVVETAGDWFVYRVLGSPAEDSFAGDPSGIPGRRIVRPDELSVISPTPGGPADAPASGAYLTLTTCHPKYSAQQRLVIHARLDRPATSKADAPDGPPELGG
ncbi:class E sortase [Blastococcus sp. TF02A_35]|uniref:class E sortase n=1 Tax=Blastococcus sp. TF02A-35 TaxID=2559612 RepID=UPI0010734CD9|nr:class E sortase [Blastococcus sp. TF02A_35]TFV45412.1 class E sortase [Blastococcus sp. TF02A_35]